MDSEEEEDFYSIMSDENLQCTQEELGHTDQPVDRLNARRTQTNTTQHQRLSFQRNSMKPLSGYGQCVSAQKQAANKTMNKQADIINNQSGDKSLSTPLPQNSAGTKDQIAINRQGSNSVAANNEGAGETPTGERRGQTQKNKIFHIPRPDEAFQQLQIEQNAQKVDSKKKVEQKIASIATMVGQEQTPRDPQIEALNMEKIARESQDTVVIRQVFDRTTRRKTIIFQNRKQEEEKRERLDNIYTIMESKAASMEMIDEAASECPSFKKGGKQFVSHKSASMKAHNMNNNEHNLGQEAGEVEAGNGVEAGEMEADDVEADDVEASDADFQDQFIKEKPIFEFEVIIAACLVRQANGVFSKYKIELNDANLIINKIYVIPLAAVSKIKLIKGLIRPQLKLTYTQWEKKSAHKANNKQRIFSTSNVLEPKRSLGENSNKDFHHQNKEMFLCDGYELIFTLFASIIVRKLYGNGIKIPEPLLVNSFVMPAGRSEAYNTSGVIYKQSKVVKKWDQRYGLVKDHVFTTSHFKKRSATDGNPQQQVGKCTLKVKRMEQLWTRFELNQGQLVVKLFHGWEKVQVGIPLHNYADILRGGNWLYGLVTVLRGAD